VTHFCETCGLRIAAPGRCKTCDPKAGQEEASERSAVVAAPTKNESAKADDKAAAAARKG
jgi:hypothetical protein